MTLDALLLPWVETKEPVDVVAVLNVEGDLERRRREEERGST